MTLKELTILSLSIFALSGCVKNDDSNYTLSESGYKCLVNAQGEEVAVLEDSYQNLSSVRSYKDKLVVMGDLDFGQMTTVLDPKTGEILDSFMHFYLTNPWDENRPALQSPSGRYLLFRKFHPAFSQEPKTSNFVMLYDLEKTAKQNRINTCNEAENDIVCGQIYAGKFFYPLNEDFECSTCSEYKTIVYDDEKYTYIIGNKWDSPKTVLQISYPKIAENEFLIVEETKSGLTKKLLKFEQAKLFDKDGKALEYTKDLEENFYMVDFSLKGNTLIISNLKDSSAVAKMIFEL